MAPFLKCLTPKPRQLLPAFQGPQNASPQGSFHAAQQATIDGGPASLYTSATKRLAGHTTCQKEGRTRSGSGQSQHRMYSCEDVIDRHPIVFARRPDTSYDQSVVWSAIGPGWSSSGYRLLGAMKDPAKTPFLGH